MANTIQQRKYITESRSQSSFTPKQIAEFYFKPYLKEDGDPTGLQSTRSPDADIVAAPKFESAVIKVLGAADVTEETAKVGFADRILKRRKVQEDRSAYIQLNAISPTSNAAERLFSMARMVLSSEQSLAAIYCRRRWK
eukprot:jgi/Phyca11/19297/fgenesh1_pg.PHYCAscaffold_47_\